MSLLAAEPSRWSFGWEALVAVGTLGLAVATVVLALLTRALARSGTAEVRAQWRPVLVLGVDPWSSPAEMAADVPSDMPTRTGRAVQVIVRPARIVLFVRVRNVGRGPALHVRAQLEPGGLSPDDWARGALAPGDDQILRFEVGKEAPPSIQLLLDYRDLSGRSHATSVTVLVRGEFAVRNRNATTCFMVIVSCSSSRHETRAA
jgi:hypothetical protein